jgi:hypothetical protein
MSDAAITASFGPIKQDRAALTSSSRRTLDALYRHPLAHNLDRQDVLALFNRIGTVEQGHNHELTLSLGDEHHKFAASHDKDLSPDEVMALRHMLDRAGWGPGLKAPLTESEEPSAPDGDVVVVVQTGEARLLHLDRSASERSGQVIRADDPNHVLAHVSHHDQVRDAGKRDSATDHFNEAVAQALVPLGRIVLIGHGHGHSTAAQGLRAYLEHHHKLIAARLTEDVSADIERSTEPQLLDLARKALAA